MYILWAWDLKQDKFLLPADSTVHATHLELDAISAKNCVQDFKPELWKVGHNCALMGLMANALILLNDSLFAEPAALHPRLLDCMYKNGCRWR